MYKHFVVIVAAIQLALCPTPVVAADDKPEEVVAKALAAFQKEDWDAVAGLVHPSFLSTFKRELIECLEGAGRWANHPLEKPERENLLRLFGEKSSVNDIRQLDAAKAYAVLLPHMEVFSLSESKVLGAIHEEATQEAHVVFRVRLTPRGDRRSSLSIRRTQVGTLSKSGNDWRITELPHYTAGVGFLLSNMRIRKP